MYASTDQAYKGKRGQLRIITVAAPRGRECVFGSTPKNSVCSAQHGLFGLNTRSYLQCVAMLRVFALLPGVLAVHLHCC